MLSVNRKNKKNEYWFLLFSSLKVSGRTLNVVTFGTLFLIFVLNSFRISMKTGFLAGFVFLVLYACQPKVQKPIESLVSVDSILINIHPPQLPDLNFKVEHGKITDTRWSEFINRKISDCSDAGGGKVILSAGEYFCEGPVVLKSNVNLHLEEGARLVFSQNPADYLPVVFVRWEGTEAYNYSPFIYANNMENIAITGNGIVDGNGLGEESFRQWRPLQKDDQNKLREMGRDGVPVEERIFGEGHYLRPQLIHFVNCKNILLENITVTNGAFWLIQPTYCSNITIRGVKVNSKFINNDGVDLDSSSDVLIENCHFNTGDDFVAIKSGRDQDGWRVNRSCKNIVIRNSFSDDCLHGISFGSEISGGIENVYVENLSFKKIRQYGLQFKSNKDRGGYIKNIHVNGIQIDSTETCISFTNQYHSYSGGNSPSLFENIRIENVDCNVAVKMAISMEGLPEMPIRNVELFHVRVFNSNKASVIENVENLVTKNSDIPGFFYAE